MNLDQLENHVKKLEMDLSASRTNLWALKNQLNELEYRPRVLQEKIAKAKKRYSNIAQELKSQLSDIRAIMLDFDRQRRELSDLDSAVEQIIQSDPEHEETDLDLLKTDLRRMLGDRREIIKKLQSTYQRLFKNIQNLEFVEQQIAARAQEEAQFLDEHLLWIRSAKIIGIQDLRNLPSALKWICSPLNWWQVFQTVMLSMKRQPVQWALGILVPFIFICLRPWAHRSLSRIALKVYSLKTDSFVLTLKALALTVRPSLGWPLLMGMAGRQLGRLASAEDLFFQY
ncbi:MAG: hypothetical protein GY850_46815 [bacterium]|nr:hypothetical protein [bacterium]